MKGLTKDIESNAFARADGLPNMEPIGGIQTSSLTNEKRSEFPEHNPQAPLFQVWISILLTRIWNRTLVQHSKQSTKQPTKRHRPRLLQNKDDDNEVPYMMTSCPKHIQSKGKQSDTEWQVYKTLTLECLFENPDEGHPTEKEATYSPYGGRMDQSQEETTGFFYVKQLDDGNGEKGWSLVDPDGYRFLSVGVNSVSSGQKNELFQKAYQEQFHGSEQAWAVQTQATLVQRLGFNTLGSWSDPKPFQDANIPVAYCPRWNFMLTYKNVRPGGPYNIWKQPMPVFDPEWESFCMEHAEKLQDTKDDPWILGHFSDNELPFHEKNLINRYLELPETDPGHKAAQKWLDDHEKTTETIGIEDHRAFCHIMIDRYFHFVQKAIKTHDPNHLYLGTRFHGYVSGQDVTYAASGPYLDVVTVNYYHRWTPEQAKIQKWAELSQKPIMITEWYAKGDDALATGDKEIVKLDNESGAGFTVPTQADRGAFYENFSLNLLRNRNIVGWHWFRYADYSSNCGIVDKNFHAWPELANSMQRVNRHKYSLSDFLKGQEEDDKELFMDKAKIVSQEE